jgi:hypothetical protein
MYPDRPMDYEGMSQVNIEYEYWQWYPTQGMSQKSTLNINMHINMSSTQGLRPRTPTPSAGPAHFATPHIIEDIARVLSKTPRHNLKPV